jgi:choline dehydrogenase-like flavoprotein
MSQTDCDVLIVGAGISGAMIAYKAASAGLRVIVLEAGVPFERRQPWIDGYYQNGWPFMSDDCAPQQSDPGADWKDPKTNYWEQVGNAQGIYGFDSNYERRGGGTTLHWLGTCMRFVPNDFTLKSTYDVAGAVDWPITYKDIEPWYCNAESEIGVSGYNQNQYTFEGPRSKPYPMSPLPQSYLDQQFMSALTGKSVSASGTEVPLFVGITPQGRNSNPYDARPACMGNSSCVPICPIQAKYDATVHIKKAMAAKTPAEFRYRTVVTGLTVDPTTAHITGVQYKTWEGDGGSEHGTGGGTLTARTYTNLRC